MCDTDNMCADTQFVEESLAFVHSNNVPAAVALVETAINQLKSQPFAPTRTAVVSLMALCRRADSLFRTAKVVDV